MTRRLNIALRSSLLIAAGAGLMVVPPIAELSVAAVLGGVALGALTVALGLAGTANDGRGTLPVSAQAAFDRALGSGLLVAALAFGLAGERWALVVFGAIGLAILSVAGMTRYTLSAARSI
jgi:hypothetical protein